MDLDFPHLPQRPLEFDPSTEAVRGWPEDAARELDLTRRVSLGGPQAIPLTGDSVTDPALRATIAGLADRYEYQAVFLALTFRSEDKDPPFEKATVELILSTVDDAGPAPVALSLTPHWVAQPVAVHRKLTIGPEITFQDVSVSLGSAERGDARTDLSTVIRAYGQRTSTPSWRIAAVPGIPIDGVYELALTVQRTRGAVAQAVVRVEPFVRHRTFLLHFQSRPLPPVMLAARL